MESRQKNQKLDVTRSHDQPKTKKKTYFKSNHIYIKAYLCKKPNEF